MPEYLGMDRLRVRLASKATRVNLRYLYYEMKNQIQAFNVTIPARWSFLSESLGWSARAVDCIADRLIFKEFADDNFGLNDILRMNSKDILTDSAVLSAMISGCGFVYISAGEDEYPRLQVIDGANATGIIDPITRLLTEGYAVLERDPENGKPVLEAYFTANETVFYPKDKMPYSIPNPTGYPLLVPIIHRPDAKRPFGHSRISRACMDIQQAALRTLQRSEISAEFYSFPQKYITGLSADAEAMDSYRASISSFLQFTNDENGEHPIVGQFAQQSMTPFADQLRVLAGLFAGETGLTLDDLGFPSVNPSSAESIKASHETLRLATRKAQRDFSVCLLNMGFVAACLRDKQHYRREALYLTRAKWEPIFEPDAAAIGLMGDAAVKVNQAVPGFFGEGNLQELIGVTADDEL